MTRSFGSVGFSAGGNAGFGEGNLASTHLGFCVKFDGEFIPLPKTDHGPKKSLEPSPKKKRKAGFLPQNGELFFNLQGWEISLLQKLYGSKVVDWKIECLRQDTLHETNSSHLKIDGWKTTFGMANAYS